MKYKLFKEVVLLKDLPEKRLKKGDVATIVEYIVRLVRMKMDIR